MSVSVCVCLSVCLSVSLSTVVLNSRDCSQKQWRPEITHFIKSPLQQTLAEKPT